MTTSSCLPPPTTEVQFRVVELATEREKEQGKLDSARDAEGRGGWGEMEHVC